jgi:hypothetical protein
MLVAQIRFLARLLRDRTRGTSFVHGMEKEWPEVLKGRDDTRSDGEGEKVARLSR